MAWEPTTGALWTVVNERDGLGDETPPDYLTSVRDGGFYGWPLLLLGQIVDHGAAGSAIGRTALAPDYALGGHTASLGLCWLPAGTLPGFRMGWVIGQHGSWTASSLSGYKVVFIPFVDGRPRRPPRDILTASFRPTSVRPMTAGRSQHRPGRFLAGGGRCRRRDLRVTGEAA